MRLHVSTLVVLFVVATLSVRYGRGTPLLTCSDYDEDATIFYIESLPIYGKLTWDGVELTASDLPLRVNDTSKTLAYVPVPNSIESDEFSYACSDEMACTTESWCVDGWTPYRGKGRTGYVTITITDTPDNPTAVNSTVEAYATDIQNIRLGFSDPDTGAAAGNATLRSLPTVGYLCADSGCAANLTINSVIQPSVGGMVVYYKAPRGSLDYTRSQASTSFLFKVTDNTNRDSDLGEITLNIVNPTVATAADVTMNEDTTATIDLAVLIGVGGPPSVGTYAEITRLPTKGTLKQFDGTPITEVPTQVEDAGGIRVKYTPNPHSHSSDITFNTWAATSVYDTFEFSGFPDSGLKSPKADISIYVNPVNDAPFVGCQSNLCDLTGLTQSDPEKGIEFTVNFTDIDPDKPENQYYRLTILPSEPFSVSIFDPSILASSSLYRLAGDGYIDGLTDVIAPYSVIRSILSNPLRLYPVRPAEESDPATVEVTVADFYFFRPTGSQPSRFTGSLSATAVFNFVITTNPDAGSTGTSQSLIKSLGILGGIGGGALFLIGACVYLGYAGKQKAIAKALQAAGLAK